MRTINKTLLRQLVKSEHGGRTKLAKAIECSPHTVSNWLRPEYDWGLDEVHAKKAAKHFKVPVSLLFPLAVTSEDEATG